MLDFRVIGCGLLWVGAAQGCAVDVAGLPDDVTVDAAPPADELGRGDGGSTDLGPTDLGPTDLGPRPDLFDCTPVDETCNGRDDDCDDDVDEGLSDQPCDDDGDGCLDGRSNCSGGGLVCEGDDATMADEACDGPDADDEADGAWACDANALTCQGDCVAMAEACNQRDDDCDGAVDEDGACSDEADDCRAVLRGDAVYLFCTDPGGDSWGASEDECARGEYELARIDDEAERAFLATESGSGNWWVGARTDSWTGSGRRDKDNWEWRPSEADVNHDLWAENEPSGDGQCGHIGSWFGGRMNDASCGDGFAYICEGRVRP